MLSAVVHGAALVSLHHRASFTLEREVDKCFKSDIVYITRRKFQDCINKVTKYLDDTRSDRYS